MHSAEPRVRAQHYTGSENQGGGQKSLSQHYFVAPGLFAQEQEKIFSQAWIVSGHQSKLEKPGDYIVSTVASESVILVRNQNSDVRCFFNVCRHRGTRLIETTAGHCRAIQCPYHAWTYDLDGRLTGAPHMDDLTSGFNKNDYSLRAPALHIWEGFLFVNLRSTPAGGAGDIAHRWFKPLEGKFSEWNLNNLRSHRRIRYDVAANWKLIFENYSECYHCPGVHPALSKLSPYDSAENDLSEGPFLGGFMKINPGKSLTMSGNACAIPVALSHHAPEERDPPGIGRVLYYSIFPNMLLSMHPDYVMVHQIWPEAPNRTVIYCDWLFHPKADSQENFRPDDAVEFWDMTNRQDWHVCELSQQGIESRAYEPGPYSSRESMPAAWDRYYLKVMKDAG